MAGRLKGDKSDALKCALCLDIFRSPKILPCYHTFCAQCLQNLTAQHFGRPFPCPSCRTLTPVPAGGVSMFQANFYIDPEDLEKARNGSFCTTHPRQELDWFCFDCDQVVCLKCAVTEHKTHETDDLIAEAARAKIQLSEHEVMLQQGIHEAYNRFQSASEELRVADDKQAVCVKTIRNRQAALKAAVDKCADDAIASVERIAKGGLQRDVDCLQVQVNRVVQLKRRVQQVLDNGMNTELVSVAREVRQGRELETLRQLTRKELTKIQSPVLRITTKREDTFQLVREYIGIPATRMELVTSAPEVTLVNYFDCRGHSDCDVFCVCPTDNNMVWVSFESDDSPQKSQSKSYNETGARFKQEGDGERRSWTGRAGSTSLFMKNETKSTIHTYAKSPVVYRLYNDGTWRSYVYRTKTLETNPVMYEARLVITITSSLHRAFDVNRSEQLFVVLEEAKPPDNQRTVRLFKYPKPEAIALYSPPIAPSVLSDVCFYTLGGQEMLLVADTLNDAIHLVNVKSGSLSFARYLAHGCPLLMAPTALNTDIRGRLWVGCRGGKILTFERGNTQSLPVQGPR